MLHEYRLLRPAFRRYRRVYALGVLAILVSVGLRLWIPLLVRGGFDELAASGAQEGGAREVRGALVTIALWIVGTALVAALVRTSSRVLVLGVSRRVAHDLRESLFAHLLRLAPSFFVRNPAGQILSRCVNDMQNVQGLVGPVVLYLVETAALFAVGVTMMVTIDPLLTLCALAPFPVFLVVARRMALRIQDGSRAAQNSLGEIAAKVDESLSGQLVIKTLTLEEPDAARFAAHAREYRALNLDVTRTRAYLIPLMMGLASLSLLIVLALMGSGLFARTGVGSLVALVLYLQMLAGPTRTLGFVISSLRRGAAALERIGEILETEVTLVEPEGPRTPASPRGEIEVRDLSIEYPPLARQPHLSGSLPEHLLGPGGEDRGRRVLERVSLKVPAGTTLGIVGHTGSGKTTLVRALARQLEVPPGTVFIDGVDVTELGLAELRRRIGYVPQEAFLFSSSLAQNVALGRPEAEREEIETALRNARLEQDLDQLPLGLETLVGERGVQLSGGQRQRAALARVLLLEPDVLILDDTLSAVDTATADQIQAHLRGFGARRTTIVVAHRLSSVRHADQIVVLEDGRIVERGTHAELLAQGGRYTALWQRQERSAEREALLERELEEGIDLADGVELGEGLGR